MLQMFVLIALGVLLALLDMWYIVRFAHFISPQEADQIDAFQINSGVGNDSKVSGTSGTQFAMLLQARLAQLQDEFRYEPQAATQHATNSTDSVPPLAGTVRPIELPKALSWPMYFDFHEFKELDLKLNVGGTELGPMLSWGQRVLSEDRLIRTTVNYQAGGADVALAFPNGSPMFLEIKADATADQRAIDKLIVDYVSHAIIKRRLQAIDQVLGDLSVSEFRSLLQVLRLVKELNRQQRLLGELLPSSSYSGILPTLREQLKLTPNWKPLVHLSAEVAANANVWDLASVLLKKELVLTDGKDPKLADLQKQLASVGEKLAEQQAAVSPPSISVPTTRQTFTEESIRSELAVPSGDTPRKGRIAIIGPDPDRLVRAIPNVQSQQMSEDTLREYTESLRAAVRLVYPSAEIVYGDLSSDAGYGVVSTSQLLHAFDKLAAANPKPDVILCSYGPLQGEILKDMLDTVADAGILVVLPAGNEPHATSEWEKSIGDRVMYVAATDANGKKASFSNEFDGCFWAPGTGIPVKVNDAIQVRDGTGFAAALGAGVAARLRTLEMQPSSIPEFLKLLHETSLQSASGVKILNYRNAADALTARATTEPSPR